MELLDEFLAQFERGEVGCGRNLDAHFQARADIITVVGAALREPASLLVIVGGFGPGDLIAGVLGFF